MRHACVRGLYNGAPLTIAWMFGRYYSLGNRYSRLSIFSMWDMYFDIMESRAISFSHNRTDFCTIVPIGSAVDRIVAAPSDCKGLVYMSRLPQYLAIIRNATVAPRISDSRKLLTGRR